MVDAQVMVYRGANAPELSLSSRENPAWMRGPPWESKCYGTTMKGTTTKLFASFDSATKLYLSTNRMRL